MIRSGIRRRSLDALTTVPMRSRPMGQHTAETVHQKKTSEHTPPAPLRTPAPTPVVTQPHPDPVSQAIAEAKSCPPAKACPPATQTGSSQKLHSAGTPQSYAESSPMKTPSAASSPQRKIPTGTRSGREVKNTHMHDFVYQTK